MDTAERTDREEDEDEEEGKEERKQERKGWGILKHLRRKITQRPTV